MQFIENPSIEFLDKFTEEIIKSIAWRINEEKKFENELRRAQREVEIGKLRKRFENYGEKTPKVHSAPEPKKIIIRPLANLPSKPIENPAPPQKTIIPAPVATGPKTTVQQPKKPQEIPAKKLPVTKIPMPAQQMMPLQPGEVDFGKIAFLVKDPLVTYIECPGEKKNIIIKRAGATMKTQITLEKEEIQNIIKSFSETARIPLVEGMLNARIRNLEIAAIVSEAISPSFILRKIIAQVLPTQPTTLERPMMQFPAPGTQLQAPAQAMPPVNRPFTPAYPPMQQQIQNQTQEKEGFMNKKFKIGK